MQNQYIIDEIYNKALFGVNISLKTHNFDIYSWKAFISNYTLNFAESSDRNFNKSIFNEEKTLSIVYHFSWI